MSHLASGIFRSRPGRPTAFAAAREAWRRGAIVFLAVGLDVAAAVMLVSRCLPSALAGVVLAGLGWWATGRLAAWHPAPSRNVLEEPTRR